MPQPSLVQNTSGSATTTAITLTLNSVTSGNCLIVEFLAQSSSVNPPVLADSNGTIVQAVNGGHFGTGTATTAIIAYVANANSGTHTFTLTPASSIRPSFAAVQEWSGITTTSPADQHANGGGTTAQTLTSGTTPATTAATELVIACIGMSSSVGVASIGITDPPAGFASLAVAQNDTASATGAEICYRVVTSIGTQSTSWSWTDGNTRSSASAIATFFSTAAVIQPPMPLGGLPRVQMHYR